MRTLLLILALLAPLSVFSDSFAWQLPAGQSKSRTTDEFEAVALSWAVFDAATLEVRASADGVVWSEWFPIGINSDLSDPSTGQWFSNIVHFGSVQRHIEYRTERVQPEITFTFFAPPRSRRPRIQANAITYGPVVIRSRTEWGSPDGAGSRWTPAYTTVTHEVVHHTAGSNAITDWENEVRNIWFFHTVTRGWGDIGYNFLIDPNGVIYEGRAGGLGAIGAHFSCRNSNTVGVALMGDFTSVEPTAAALRSLDGLLEELARRHALDLGATRVHTPTATPLPTVISHRDGNSLPGSCTITSCPGDRLYALLPSIRAQLSTCERISIIDAPSSRTVAHGSKVEISVGVTGAAPITYQWYSGTSGDTSSPVPGAGTHTLAFTATTDASYWVRIANECGTVDTAEARVRIGDTPDRKRTKRP